jgi:hypothetical protein
MKRILSFFAVLGLAASGAGIASANLLANPDLDTTAVSTQLGATPVNWVAASSKSATGVFNDGLSSEGFANVLQAGGNGIFFKPFQGNLANPNATPPTVENLLSASISQDVAAGPGQAFSLTGWAGAGAGYIGLTDASVKSQFALQYIDAGNAVIGSSVLDLPLGTANGNPFNYAQYTVNSGLAPAGTVAVRALAQMLNAYGNPAGGDQAFVVDSFELVRTIPEPASLVLVGLSVVGLIGIRRRSS